jgi:predicted N-acyltransferase
LVNNDEQLLLDCFADGFNERQYALEAGKDELDDFFASMEITDDQRNVLKKTARQLSRGLTISVLEAADMIKSRWQSRQKATV